MKYKMIAMDLDGTLLPENQYISEKNIAAIKAAFDLGVRVTISTGRMYASARIFTEVLPANISMICLNGAYIMDSDSMDPIYVRPMKEKDIIDIIRICKLYNAGLHFYSHDTIFAEKPSEYYSALNKNLPESKRIKFEIVQESNWREVIKKSGSKILKGLIVVDNADKLERLMGDVNGTDVEAVKMGPDCIEIMDKGVSKGNAVQHLSDIYKINREDIICIGDNENDISMLKYAGLGVAMGNASDIVKAEADYVTLKDVEDGPAYVINKFILGR